MDQMSFFEENNNVVGYVLSDNSVVSTEQIEKARRTNSKSNTMTTEEDDFGESYASGRVYRPPLSFTALKVFSIENSYHSKAMQRKAIDAFNDYEIVPIERKGVPFNTDNRKLSRSDKILYNFFDNCNSNFMEMCRNLSIDYQNFSFGTLELIRDRKGTPLRLNHAQSDTFRIARNMSDNMYTDEKFLVQVVNTHERIFSVFNENGRPNFIEPHTHNPMTEILYLTNYDINGGHYGIPSWVPAIKSLIGMDKVAEYNINFFNNEAVPRFAVICTGGKLDEQTKKTITNYFKKDLKGAQNAHKTLVLTAPKGVEIKLTPLAVEIKEGSFKFYRKDCRDEIISAHEVPPHRLQILDSGSSGTMSPGTVFALDKVYKYSVIQPLQEKIASMLNQLIRYGFGITDRVIRFKPLDIGEDKEKADTMRIIAAAHEKYYATGILTVDEIRKELKYQPYSEMDVEEDVKEWATTPRTVYLVRQAEQQAMQEGINGNPNGDNINQSPNEHDDKSRQQTGNTQFSDSQVQQLTMKRLEVLKQLGEELTVSMNRPYNDGRSEH